MPEVDVLDEMLLDEISQFVSTVSKHIFRSLTVAQCDTLEDLIYTLVIETVNAPKKEKPNSKQFTRLNITTQIFETVNFALPVDNTEEWDDISLFINSNHIKSCANCDHCSSARLVCLVDDDNEYEVDYTSVCGIWSKRTTND